MLKLEAEVARQIGHLVDIADAAVMNPAKQLGGAKPLLTQFFAERRQPLEVPSTYLWARTIEDLHVNSLWQRLR